MAVLAGISWPFRTGRRGLPEAARGSDVIRSTIIALLVTRKRSRVMRPDVGTNLLNFIFEVQGPVLVALIQKEVSDAIRDQIPNVRILDLPVIEDGNRIIMNVVYSINGVQDETGEIVLMR